VVTQDVSGECVQLGVQALDAQPEFFGTLRLALPPVVRDNGAVDLHANRQRAGNDIGRKAFSIRTVGDRGPGNQHDRGFRRLCPDGKAESAGGNSPLTGDRHTCVLNGFPTSHLPSMRDDYIKDALKAIPDPNILINVVSRRVKQLKRGNRPLVESLEKLTPEDTALREVIDGKISYELA
jgi:DNA-directed RNA polymerase subunit omega